jgi:hypothetical protein
MAGAALLWSYAASAQEPGRVDFKTAKALRLCQRQGRSE